MPEAPQFGRSSISTRVGVAVLLVAGAAGVASIAMQLRPQNLPPTPQIVSQHSGSINASQPCRPNQPCAGPTVSAKDPEGEQVTYKFYDKTTGQPVGQPITADSGKPVTPEFKFDKSGQQQLYMVVQDGAGHTSADYPIIIPVQ